MIAALKQGDHAAFKEAFDEYHEKVYHFLLLKTGSASISEEVSQVTFVRLWKYRSSLNEEIALPVQIFRIAKTALIDQIRKDRHSLRFAARLKADQNENQVTNLYYQREVSATLQQALQTLPIARRKVFELSRIHGYSYKEIAGQLSISVKTVENHIGNAIKQLKSFFNLLSAFLFFWLF
jgi:RNA polymerase sigma-70 factor (family 1)